jgi:hypothetical protein
MAAASAPIQHDAGTKLGAFEKHNPGAYTGLVK